jgi:hypothetical protein
MLHHRNRQRQRPPTFRKPSERWGTRKFRNKFKNKITSKTNHHKMSCPSGIISGATRSILGSTDVKGRATRRLLPKPNGELSNYGSVTRENWLPQDRSSKRRRRRKKRRKKRKNVKKTQSPVRNRRATIGRGMPIGAGPRFLVVVIMWTQGTREGGGCSVSKARSRGSVVSADVNCNWYQPCWMGSLKPDTQVREMALAGDGRRSFGVARRNPCHIFGRDFFTTGLSRNRRLRLGHPSL